MNDSQAVESRFYKGPESSCYDVAGNRLVVVCFCWKGKAHLEDGANCQDRANVYACFAEGTVSNRLVAVVADGVSTQPLSGKGATLACDAIGEEFCERNSTISPPLERFKKAQARFIEMCRADKGQEPPTASEDESGQAPPPLDSVVEYATTVLVLCTDGANYWAAGVGDGAIYSISSGGHTAKRLTEIHREGYVNEVRPLTNPKWDIGYFESHTDFVAEREIEGFCLMTDGLSESIGNPNAYFAAVWPELRTRLGKPAELAEYAEAFCRYWEDHKFSDDDKTLLAIFVNP